MAKIGVVKHIEVDEIFTFAKNDAGGLAIYTEASPSTTSWLTEEEWDNLVYNVNMLVFNRSVCSKP